MLSLSALAHVVSYLSDGAPLAFAASNPTARIAAETFRAEERYEWSPTGAAPQLPGARETFGVYEARLQRHAGVRVGALVCVYHDSTGGLADPPPARAAAMCSAQTSVIQAEYSSPPLFPTDAEEEVEMRGEGAASSPAEASGDRYETPQSGARERVRYFTGPNHRSVYVWMDGAGPTTSNTNANSHPLDTPLTELLARTRWWLHRPGVSTLSRAGGPPANVAWPLPPPPALYLHLYGRHSSHIARVCEELLPPSAATTRTGAGSGLDMLFGPAQPFLPVAAPSTALTPYGAAGSENGRGALEQQQQQAVSRQEMGALPPVLEGLFIVSHPLLHMHITSEEEEVEERAGLPPAALHSDVVSRLKILKVNGAVMDDSGFHRFFMGTAKASPIAKTLSTAMPFLQLCDVGFHRAMTVLPVLTLSSGGHSPLSHLRFLSHLNLQCTFIGNDVVATIALTCPRLQNLSMGSCAHVSALAPLATLTALWRLDAHSTAIDNAGIAAFASGACVALEELSLAGCTSLTEVWALAGLQSLCRLDLRGVAVRTGLDKLAACQKLQEVRLGYTGTTAEQTHWSVLDTALATAFCQLQTLQRLVLSDVPFMTTSALEALAQARAPLRVLTLERVPHLTDLSPLASIETLCVLSVRETPRLTATGIARVAECPELRRLCLCDCEGVDDLSALARAPQLRHLDASTSSPRLMPTSLSAFRAPRPGLGARCSAVETLVLRRHAGVTEVGFLGSLPNLRVLDVSETGVTDAGLYGLGTSRSLERLCLRRCAAVSGVAGLEAIPTLRTLDLGHTSVTDAGLHALPLAPSLEVLLLDGCTGMAFHSPAGMFPSLRMLSLADTSSSLTDASLESWCVLADSCEERAADTLRTPFPALDELDLTGCHSVTSIMPLLTMPRLSRLHLRGTSVCADGLKYLPELPELQYLNIRDVHTIHALWPLFVHERLRAIDMRGLTGGPVRSGGDGGTALQHLPPNVLAADALVEELWVSGAGPLRLLCPLIANRLALPRLRVIQVADWEGDEGGADAGSDVLDELHLHRPLLAVKLIKECE